MEWIANTTSVTTCAAKKKKCKIYVKSNIAKSKLFL